MKLLQLPPLQFLKAARLQCTTKPGSTSTKSVLQLCTTFTDLVLLGGEDGDPAFPPQRFFLFCNLGQNLIRWVGSLQYQQPDGLSEKRDLLAGL